MRRALPTAALAVLLATMTAPALGQDADTVDVRSAEADAPRPAVTVPLPTGRGVFYYRAGEPGGVRIRSRNGVRRPAPPAAAPARPAAQAPLREREAMAAPSIEVVVPEREAPAAEGVSRLDLLLLERSLLRAIDQRLAALALDRRDDDDDDRPYLPLTPTPSPPQVIVVPDQTPPVPVAPVPAPEAPVPPATPIAPAPEPPPEPVLPVPVDPIVQEVERAILETGLLVTNRVNFEFGEATLIPVSENLLGTIGDVLLRYPDVRVRIGGHTDSISSAAYNLQLSQRRADTVRDFLIGYGVDADRLVAVGYGEAFPIASNDTDTGRALNRRVEFTVLNPEVVGPRSLPVDDEEDALRRVIREELERLRNDDGR